MTAFVAVGCTAGSVIGTGGNGVAEGIVLVGTGEGAGGVSGGEDIAC
jgi:hypothetical protein